MAFDQITAAIFESQWAITPTKMQAIVSLIELRLAGNKVDEADIQLTLAASKMPEAPAGAKSIAVLPLFGVMAQHAGMMTRSSGGTSTSEFGADFRRARDNPDIGAIILHVNSPGGMVFGTSELADLIYSSRDAKPIITAVNSQMASAATWVGLQAHKVYITPGGETGSIGVLRMHRDISKAEDQMGVKTTLVAYPAKKIAGHPYGPLDEATAKEIQEGNMATYDRMTAAIARGRGIRQATVQKGYGEGGMLRAEQALAEGMVDGIKTIEAVIEETVAMVKGKSRSRSRAAAAAAALALAEAEGP